MKRGPKRQEPRPGVDEEAVLEFERLRNQAQSLAWEQRDLAFRARRRRNLVRNAGLAAAAVATIFSALVMAGRGGLTWLTLALWAVSAGCLALPRRCEIDRLTKASQLERLQETCEFLLEEHLRGQLPDAQFRSQLDFCTRHFRDLSQSLDHPFR